MEKQELVQAIIEKSQELNELFSQAVNSGLVVNVQALNATYSHNHFSLEVKEETILFKSEI